MATMLDLEPFEHKGENFVWNSIKNNLPDDIICYYNREVKGKEFDFCLLIKNIGLVIIEVKGWNNSHIKEIKSPDEIYLNGESKPIKSPKKQARMYKFNLINVLNEKYGINPMVIDMVCYPFMSQNDYENNNLNIVSEPEFTLFNEDITSKTNFSRKIVKAYQKSNFISGCDSVTGKIYQICRSHFEGNKFDDPKGKIENSYSKLTIYDDELSLNDIDEIMTSYFQGTKQIIFVSKYSDIEYLAEALCKKLNDNNIALIDNNFILSNNCNNIFKVRNNRLSLFNFEVFFLNGYRASSRIVIYNGDFSIEQEKILTDLYNYIGFNFQQYCIEHAEINKDIYIKAGAGTGKTYSMVSRIAYLCHKSSNSNIFSIYDDIAMLTFTKEASTNMKKRLKSLFMNYFILTKDANYLELASNVENVRISTIHSFAKEIIQYTVLPFGIGSNFSTIVSNYDKSIIFDRVFNEYLINTDYEQIISSDISIYDLKKYLLEISNQLYNKGLDIKDIPIESFGKPLQKFPFINDLIENVVIKTEEEYTKYLLDNNYINLNEYMIYLNKCVKSEFFNSNLFKFKYVFIDEFQDTDDTQISAFLQMQEKLKFNFFIVGDIKQSIYRFRGATVDAFQTMGCNLDKWLKFTLNINYRTDKRLLEKLNTLFSNISNNRNLLPYSNDDKLIGIKINNNYSENDLISKFDFSENKFYEVLKEQKSKIEEVLKEKPLSENERTIAILVRSNYNIKQVLKYVQKYDISIETSSIGDLYQLQSTIDLCKLVSALCNPKNPVYLYDLIHSNNIDVNFPILNLLGKSKEKKLEILVNCLDMYYKNKLNLTWGELIYQVQNKPILMMLKLIYDKTEPWKKYSLDKDKQEYYCSNYELVFEELSNMNKRNYLTLDSINQSLHIVITTNMEAKSYPLKKNKNQVRVVCTTVHKAKGLEYGTVILPFTHKSIDSLNRDGIYINYIDGKVGYCIKGNKNQNYIVSDEIELTKMEETRILYVALTRAINNVIWFDNGNFNTLNWKSLLEEL